MTRTNLIFTHGAVFSVGIAAAMIANSFRDPQGEVASSGGNTSSRTPAVRSAANLTRDEISQTSRTTQAGQRTQLQMAENPATERMAKIVRITDPMDRQRALMDLIDTLGPGEFAAVAEQFRDLDHLVDSRGEYDLILRGWAKADPLAALEYLDQNPRGRGGRAAVLSTWAGIDAAAAERWALDHYDGDKANPYMADVIRGVAGNDIATASRLAQSMPFGRERGDAVDSITRALFLQGEDAAMAYPETITDENLRGGFVAAIAKRMTDKDVNKAAAWIAAMPQGDLQNRAAREVADALAKEDPSKAATWVSTLKPEAQAEAARGVIPVMSSTDIAGTAKWVSSLAGTPNYDSMVEEFVWSCNSRAPEQSAAWIQGVANPDQQRRLYHRMLGEWARTDAAAVKQWVATNNVPTDIQKRFSH